MNTKENELKFSQANELIKAVHLMNNSELKFLFYALSIRQKNEVKIEVPFSQVLECLENSKGGNQEKKYKKVIESIISKSVLSVPMRADRLDTDLRKSLDAKNDDIIIVSGALLTSYINPMNNKVTMEFHEKFLPLLDELKYNHTWIYLEQVVKLKGKYSPRFYEFCKMILQTQSVTNFTWYLNNDSENMPNMRKFLSVENKFLEWRDLKRKVIEPSIKEINEKCSDVSLEYEPLKTSYKSAVYGIKMKIYKSSFIQNLNKNKDSDTQKEEQLEETKKASENNEVKVENNTKKEITETNERFISHYKWWED